MIAELLLSNVLIVLMDDVGVDMVGGYGEAADAPCTPTLDSIVDSGLVFRNAWASPLCSAARSLLMTGRYGYRTGIGGVINGDTPSALALSETTLPELLPPDYHARHLGKWHLASLGTPALTHANDSGFDQFAGSLGNLKLPPLGPLPCPSLGYSSWVKLIDGVESCSTTYATTDTVDDAVDALRTMPEPWLLVVALHAIHGPYHDAPFVVCDPPENQGKGMMEALDTELARLFSAVPPNTYTFLTSDNGTSKEVATGEECFHPSKSKGTVYEGGLRVPLVVAGPQVPRGEVEAIVGLVDLFATVADLLGAESEAEDSVSLLPYLRGSKAPQRRTIYAERFKPDGDPWAAEFWRQAARNERYKLIRRHEQGELLDVEFYDLWLDPCEASNLWPPPAELVGEYRELAASMPERGPGRPPR